MLSCCSDSSLAETRSLKTDLDHDTAGSDPLQEAQAWLAQLTSGTATAADADALNAWRARSPAHGRAFAEAALLWNVMGDATRDVVARNPTLAATTAAPRARGLVARRSFIGGGLLAASLTGAAVVHPPFGLWPSWSEFVAEHRTAKGERRRIEVADRMPVQINTSTSIDLRPPADGAVQIELIAGEAAFAQQDARPQDIVVRAGAGQARAQLATFNIRRDADAVSVSCIQGDVLVSCGAGTAVLRDGQQARYDAQGLGQVVAIDPDVVTAWQRGLLIFRDEPLWRVIAEVNRYRSGQIVLLDGQLGRRRIVASFRLDRIDDVVGFVAEAVQARVRRLPGGIVLLG
jgi:transmembrane sensor